jgi:hypothetical protein
MKVAAGNDRALVDGFWFQRAVVVSIMGPACFGVFNLLLGKDANWDFLNYHYYNAWAYLQQRLALDVAVAHHATYYNPLLDVPFFLGAQHLPAWVMGLLLAGVQGLNFTLLFWLSWIVLPVEPRRLRLEVALLVALAGMAGGGALGQLGVVSYDNVLGLGVLAALLIVAGQARRICAGGLGSALACSLAAGAMVGAAAGLKLTAALYCVGLCTALLALPATIGRRLLVAFGFGLGVLAAMALLALPWSLQLWERTGNPFFPYFNALFHSPLVSAEFNRDATFIPRTLFERSFFPFFFTADSLKVAEFHFRDMRLLMVFVLLPLGWLLCRRRRGAAAPAMAPSPARRYILAAAGFSYLVWLALFCIYRYLIPLEILAPLLIALCLDLLPIPPRGRLALLAIGLALSQLVAHSEFDQRRAWDTPYVAVRVPAIAHPATTLVLLSGAAPMGYALPSFPPGPAFLRIQSHITGGQPPNGLDIAMRQRVAAHRGDLFALFAPWEETAARVALAQYGLDLAPEPCRYVSSNVAAPLKFCALR